MSFVADPDRYARMQYNRVGRSGLKLPGALARALAQLRPRPSARHAARNRAPRVRPRRHALRPREQLRPSCRQRRGELRPHARRRPRAVPRRDHRLVEGRLRHVARPLRRLRVAQVPARRRSTRASRRLGLDYVDIFYSHRPDPETPDRGDDGRARERRAPGQGALRRHLELRPRADPRGRGGARGGGRAAAHPPAALLDVRPAHRGRALPRARGGRRGEHRVLPARTGPAHRPLPRRRGPGGLTGRDEPLPLARPHQRRLPRAGACARRDRQGARPDARAARARLGPAPAARRERAHRRVERRPAGAERRGTRRRRRSPTRRSLASSPSPRTAPPSAEWATSSRCSPRSSSARTGA